MYQKVRERKLKHKIFQYIAKLFGFSVIFLTEKELEKEIEETKKRHDDIEEWFKKHGEAASNLVFFQQDAKASYLADKLACLKAANQVAADMDFMHERI